jgi:Transposase DDE domain
MEHQLFEEIVALLRVFGKQKQNPHRTYDDMNVVKVWFWAALHDRPVSWACDRRNWPAHERRVAKPSSSTMSRRLNTDSIRQLLLRLEQELLVPRGRALLWFIDGKPLAISGCSKDRQAGYGRAARCKAKGYKLHAIVANDGSLAAWRIAPMNVDERVMAEHMLRVADIQGYVVADSNYDSNILHKACDDRGNLQLVTPRRYGPNHGHGHRRQTPGRMRSKELLENPWPAFGESLLRQRAEIERFYARLTNWGGALTHLPPWIRTHRRVHRWVQAKLLFTALRQRVRQRTCAAG